jgi:hypothetical protein
MAFTGVVSPAGPMSEADIEASRVYGKLDERGLIKCPLWIALRTQVDHFAKTAKCPTADMPLR